MRSKRFFNTIPDITLFASIIAACTLDLFLPIIDIVEPPLSFVGLLVLSIGVALAIHSLSLIRSKRASTDITNTSTVLITEGIFSLTRNPLYLSELFIVTGVAIAIGSFTALLCPIVYFLVVQSVVIPFEEKQLQAKFGQKYELYTLTVRRWL